MKQVLNPLKQSFAQTYLLILIAILSNAPIHAQQAEAKRNIKHKEVFSNRFPQTLSFRNDKLGLRDGYEYWEKIHFPFNSITKKYLKEEVDMDPVFAKWANKYALENPEKLMLVHLNGEGKSVNDPSIHKNYFPGHWVYEAGTVPNEDISKDQKVIQLQTAKPFSENAYTVHGKNVNSKKLPHDVIIVELDGNGNRIWDKSEYATIEKVDYKSNVITIKRGQHQSKRRNFTKGKTYIAPLAGDFWGGNLMWYYNLSSSCPEDPNGNSCSDIFVDEMKDWFAADGILEHIDGIGFDVNYFETDHKTWDCNNDGKADSGFVDGKNKWRSGDLNFLKNIRETFGEEFIITADGWRDEMQRAVGILNGMETEGLCRPNDGYRQISRTINQQTYWSKFNTTKYQFSYITSKLRHPDDMKIEAQLNRMGIGLACCLGVSYAYSPPLYIPEIFGGELNRTNWLGKPTSELKYTALETPNLLNNFGSVIDETALKQFDFHDANYLLKDNTLFIEGTGQNVYEDLIVTGPELKIPSGDLMVLFEAKAIQGFVDLDKDSRIPRKINIKIEGMPESSPEPMNSHLFNNDLAGYMGIAGFTTQMFYFRNVGNTGKPLRIIFEAEEQGEFAIRNIRVHNAPATMAREFEHGIVLVNPSFDAFDFNLKNLFPEQKNYRRIKIDGSNIKYLGGSFNEISSYNNGDSISNISKVTVPGLNALFLIKPKTD